MTIGTSLLCLLAVLGASGAMAGVATDMVAPSTRAQSDAVAAAFTAPDIQVRFEPVAQTGRLSSELGAIPAAFTERRWPSIIRALLWQRDQVRRGEPARAQEFMPQLKAVFTDEGLPPQLAWIAEVESSFDPEACSSVGARGLFQFMPGTAEQFGLDVTRTDERTIPAKCARAAARYLAQLHGRFGNWALALAAYNAGEGRVGRLLRAHRALTFEEIAVYLPAETQVYVPKVMATLAVRENIQLGSLPAPTANVTL